MYEMNKYRREWLIAKATGVHIRKVDAFEVKANGYESRRSGTIYKYRRIFQMMLLDYKYSQISLITGIHDRHLAMIIKRCAPHLLRGRGNTCSDGHSRGEKVVPLKRLNKIRIQKPKEKTWNPKSLKYE